MKKVNKGLSFLLLSSMFMVFAGCSARNPVTANTFEEKAKTFGYTMTKDTYSDANSCLTGSNAKTGGQLMFVDLKQLSDAKSFYTTKKDSIAVGSTKPAVVDSSSYNKYIVSNGDVYTVLIRMDKTIVFGQTNMSDKANLDKFIESIKY